MAKTTTVRDGWSPFFLFPTETATLDLVHLIHPSGGDESKATKGLGTKKDAQGGRPSLYGVLKKVSSMSLFIHTVFAVVRIAGVVVVVVVVCIDLTDLHLEGFE